MSDFQDLPGGPMDKDVRQLLIGSCAISMFAFALVAMHYI
jgi:hypothetical protein